MAEACRDAFGKARRHSENSCFHVPALIPSSAESEE